MRNQAVYSVLNSLPIVVRGSGLLTDELESHYVGADPGVVANIPVPPWGSLDGRFLPSLTSGSGGEGDSPMYAQLQLTRGAIGLALSALAAYDTGAATIGNPPVLRSELFALYGYTELLLGDLYCSGVPLSTIDFNADFTYHPSSTTAQVYQDAIVKEDSALALATASSVTANDTVLNLAQVLKARALLALGRYTAAADDVSTVPDAFQYRLTLSWNGQSKYNFLNYLATVSDREGQNGLPYRTSGDPRTAVTLVNNPGSAPLAPLYFPTKYDAGLSGGQVAPFVVANGIEARLIQAEAALHAGDASWLTILNALRTTCTATVGCPTPAPAGIGGVAGLPPLDDPGTATARVDTLFRERAYWLFLTGHRQGDVRRLVRDVSAGGYGRPQETVYPTGIYTGPGTGQYGSDVTVPVPSEEYMNPYFHGCLDRRA
jgi:hypothetical protein